MSQSIERNQHQQLPLALGVNAQLSDIREYLQSIKAKQNEKQEAESKALKVRLVLFCFCFFLSLLASSFYFRVFVHDFES